MNKKPKLRKWHWLAVEIVVGLLIVAILLNMLRFPMTETETYTEQQPYTVTETGEAPASYNRTTCTQRDYKFKITRDGVHMATDGSATFDYTLENQETESGTFRYKMGMAPLYLASVAQRNGEPVTFTAYTAEETVTLLPRKPTRVSPLMPASRSTVSAQYGELVVYPPRIEDCQTSAERTTLTVPTETIEMREITKSRNVTTHVSIWQLMRR